ncbi:lung seven transmembrane receptor-domain-containing protein [Halteromyces radiatus]|uniref:lung seven transmembrane receptor-domain-containing protein n=1 Tax=Halteromyces radiatus TaxID=101107 RepID=UPI00221F1856|nr:lung seven transmembrane receptor-domain-containing protein [Halteromyces radiatus]KAI8078871.1 lung seven transmembrane receptor-domain-containing protein [Halteromyces radiatus]
MSKYRDGWKKNLILWLFFLVSYSLAEEVYLTSDDYYATTCSGVWSQQSIPGGKTPFIEVTFGEKSYGSAALLVYEWEDFDKIGGYSNVTNEMEYICDEQTIRQNLCTKEQEGQFIIRVPANQTTSILTDTIPLNHTIEKAALYKVEKTGYYCVALIPTTSPGSENSTYFEAWVEWKFPYGELPAVDYPKLVLYGVFALVYLSVGVFWGIQTFRYWHDILPVQHFLSGAIFFLTVEMAFNWGFWEAYNQTGKPSWLLLALVALLNAGRTSISFFMLLIVCMGYSVVKPSLGSAMKKCIILACTHFFFGVVYSLGTMLLSPETAGFLVLLVIFPLSITMTAFYIWTLNSITTTLNTLVLRKQHVKAQMYRRLFRLLVFSVVMVVVIFILNMFTFSDRTSADWGARNWKWRWFMLDGMLNILYFVVFFVIVILWRPTDNNARYGLEQISQDEEEALDLEQRLQHRRKPNGEDEDDDAGLFELGDDFSDDEDGRHHGERVQLVTVNHHHHSSSSSATPSSPPAYSPPPSTTGDDGKKKQQNEEQSALLHVQESDDEDDELDTSEHAGLTANARKHS